MKIKKIYEKFIFQESIKFLFFFILAIYCLFFVLDFSLRGPKFFAIGTAEFSQFLLYYYYQISLYLNLFLSLGFLFAIIKVIGSMNRNNELLALQMAGLSKQKIIRPLFLIGAFLSLLSYVNTELQYPKAVRIVQNFKKQYLHSQRKERNANVQSVVLKDNTKLVYSHYDFVKNELKDVFWLLGNEIYHIKLLDLKQTPPKGHFVDHFIQDSRSFFIKKNSYRLRDLEKIYFDKKSSAFLVPFEERAITTLFWQFFQKSYSSYKEKSALSSHLNYKLTLPLIPLLIPLLLTPWLFRFSRQSNYLFILTAISLFLFIGFYTLIDAFFILTENGGGSSFVFLWMPFIILFALAILKQRFSENILRFRYLLAHRLRTR